MPSFPKLCAICYNTYSRLKQHLQCAHTVQNSAELALLIKYGNARTSGPLDCPICSRQRLARLDKHLLRGHQIMSVAEREPIMLEARRLAIAREFMDLRATDPYPPMVSTLGALSDPDDDGAMDLTVESLAPSMSSSAEQATRVVHPDSSGQPVQPPTPLKSTWQIPGERGHGGGRGGKGGRRGDRGVGGGRRRHRHGSRGGGGDNGGRGGGGGGGHGSGGGGAGAWSDDFGSAFHPVHGHHPESAEDDFCPHPGLVGEAFGYGLGSAVICWCRHCNPGSVVEDAFNSDVQPVQLPTLQFPDEGWE
ncbi:hypothetical protein D5F01_LYC00018 [Larimichthys crocea]|uniref:Uncharacterized protein n=1 Tax=Larimichthys crocea TaxID=215358 RepID=A0A6G0J7Z3_LARCR|nr:hypothetical protein D5F01_LYC00018 [Larimichthys crocea]